MSDQIRQIAERIKELREVSGVTQESLARDLGVPVETYRGYETGEVDIPVSLLYEVAARFHVELTQILTGESPKLHTYSLVRKGKGVVVHRSRHYDYQSLAYNFAGKRFEPLLVTVEAKPAGAPVETNSHPGQEFDYVVEGRLAVSIDGTELILESGDSLYFDSVHPHSMKALDDRPARFLAVIL
jgi:transcriptional regulator with XRE-family HTH domain